MNKSSKLRNQLREAACQAILTAAEEVYAEEGLHSARVESIAQRAGTSVGTLYTHFKDRDGLVTALLEFRKREMLEHIDAALARVTGQPFRVQLDETVRELIGFFDAHRAFTSILMQGELGGATQRAQVSSSNARATITAIRARLRELMRRGIDEGALRPELEDLYPALLTGLIRGAVTYELLEGREPRLLHRADQLVKFFMEGGGITRG
jgi:AcrR family transcriptional regulator